MVTVKIVVFQDVTFRKNKKTKFHSYFSIALDLRNATRDCALLCWRITYLFIRLITKCITHLLGRSAYQLLKEHILCDPLCGSIGMKQQKQMSTDVLCKQFKISLISELFATLQIIHTAGQAPPYVIIITQHYFLTSWNSLWKFKILIRFTSYSRQNKGTNYSSEY
jgi:hypothetical protein